VAQACGHHATIEKSNEAVLIAEGSTAASKVAAAIGEVSYRATDRRGTRCAMLRRAVMLDLRESGDVD